MKVGNNVLFAICTLIIGCAFCKMIFVIQDAP